MTAAAFCFSVMNYLVRLAAEELNPIEIAFFRNLFALAFMLPWLARVGLSGLATRRFPTHAWRALIGLAAMFCWFYSVALMPLAEAVSLNFTVPLFATAGAAMIRSSNSPGAASTELTSLRERLPIPTARRS